MKKSVVGKVYDGALEMAGYMGRVDAERMRVYENEMKERAGRGRLRINRGMRIIDLCMEGIVLEPY